MCGLDVDVERIKIGWKNELLIIMNRTKQVSENFGGHNKNKNRMTNASKYLFH